MRILFDQGTPVPLRSSLIGHLVDTAFELGWQTLENGELLAQAEKHNYEVLRTTDQNLQYQQNLTERKIAIVVIRSTSWPRIKHQIEAIISVINRTQPNGYYEIEIK